MNDTRIAALTKLLLEKNPVAVLGTRKAVGAAVRSIAQGAANCDSGLQQALGLLKANKIAGAAQLLQVFADDKTSQTEKDREEAALAYRNLGAITGLGGRVEMWRGGCRLNISVSAPFVWRCLTGSTVAPFPHLAHRTGHADFPHPALG